MIYYLSIYWSILLPMPVFLSISLSNLITRKTCSIFSVLIVQTCHMICHHTGTNALTTYQPSRISWFSFLETLDTSAGNGRSNVCHYLSKTPPHCSIPRRFISQSCGWSGCATHVLSTHRSVTPNHSSLSWHSPQPTSPVKLMSNTPSAASDPFQWSRDPSSSRIKFQISATTKRDTSPFLLLLVVCLKKAVMNICISVTLKFSQGQWATALT